MATCSSHSSGARIPARELALKRYLVLYFTNTGNTRFLAHKLAERLDGTVQEIKPPFRSVFGLYLWSLMRFPLPTGIAREDVERSDEVIVMGPIWGGLLIAPIRSALRRCVRAGKASHVAVCCETSDEQKDSKYGYSGVLKAAELAGRGLVKSTAAFSTDLVKPPGAGATVAIKEKIRITDASYPGLMQERLEAYASRILQI